MTIDVNQLVAQVVARERDHIIGGWLAAAGTYAESTGRSAPDLSDEDKARALERAEEIVSFRLLGALHKATRPSTAKPEWKLSRDGYWELDGYLRCRGVQFTG